MNVTESHKCPVCGYEEMRESPAEGAICPSCGTQFDSEGYDRSYRELRSNWIDRYMPWFSRGVPPPKNWSPYRQLIAADFGSDLVTHTRMRTDEDYRYAVDEAFADVRIAKQLKVLRETRDVPLTQKALAERAEMKQSRISELEGMNYSAWSVTTLKRLARALGVRFRYSFDSWAELLPDIENNLRREALAVPSFEHDLAFAGIRSRVAIGTENLAIKALFHVPTTWQQTVTAVHVFHRKPAELGTGNKSIREDQINSIAGLPYAESGVPALEN